MDIITIIGLLMGTGLIIGSIILGGEILIFISLQSAMIVLGGTFGATMIKYSLEELKKIPALLKIVFNDKNMDSEDTIDILVDFAEKARREGLLALEQEAADLNDDFLQKGIQLVVDGTDPELVRSILETKLTFLEERHQKTQGVFNTMASLSPAFGMIGTLIGLIQMLTQLDDPSNIGSGMGVALITTLYGTILSNLLFTPMAGKLDIVSQEEVLMKEVMIEGILSIQAGENPRIVREKLTAFLANENTAAEEELEGMVNE
ncbi:MAG: motility protein A [Bacillota bacterium]